MAKIRILSPAQAYARKEELVKEILDLAGGTLVAIARAPYKRNPGFQFIGSPVPRFLIANPDAPGPYFATVGTYRPTASAKGKSELAALRNLRDHLKRKPR
jgi:hypothetical protein